MTKRALALLSILLLTSCKIGLMVTKEDYNKINECFNKGYRYAVIYNETWYQAKRITCYNSEVEFDDE